MGATVASSPSDMGLVRDNFLVKHRYALDDLEESEWEKLPTGKVVTLGANPSGLCSLN